MSVDLSTELGARIRQFLASQDTAQLGTVGTEYPRVSPVRYYTDPEMNIYIHSAGGSKFENLAHVRKVCLLVHTPFQGDLVKIKGVQIFGDASVLDEGTPAREKAESFCPFPHPKGMKLIKIRPMEAVYLDAEDGERKKELWKR